MHYYTDIITLFLTSRRHWWERVNNTVIEFHLSVTSGSRWARTSSWEGRYIMKPYRAPPIKTLVTYRYVVPWVSLLISCYRRQLWANRVFLQKASFARVMISVYEGSLTGTLSTSNKQTFLFRAVYLNKHLNNTYI